MMADGDEMTERNMLLIPTFATEAKEAQWWFDHRDEVSLDLMVAVKNGLLGEGSIALSGRMQKEAQQRDLAV
jgi:hypothetical protein